MQNSFQRADLVRAYPLLWLSLAYLLGDFLASLISLPLWAWITLAAVSLLAWLLLRDRLRRFYSVFVFLTPLVIFSLSLGAARYQSEQSPLTQSDLATYNDSGQRIKVTGVISQPPLNRDSYWELRLRIESLEVIGSGEEIFVEGMLLARVSNDDAWQYGDQLVLRGRLETPAVYEDFSYRAYLERQGIGSLMPFADAVRLESGRGHPLLVTLYSLRTTAQRTLHQLFPDPEASLLTGILLGDESGLSESLKEDFNDTGARHIIAISGFNITIVAGLFLALFRRVMGPLRGAWFAIVGVALYTLLVGAQAPVLRAAIMGTLTLLARQAGRRQTALNTLAFTAAVMALINPLIIWDVGFQLSFMATLGIVLYAQPMTDWAASQLNSRLPEDWVDRLLKPLSEYVLITLAAQITTLPLLLYYFQRFSFVSLPTNILILPVQPAVMILGGLSVLLALVFFPLGQVAALIAWPFAAYTIRVVEWFARLSWASAALPPVSPLSILLFYGVLALFTLRPSTWTLNKPQLRPATWLAALAFFNLCVWNSALAVPDGHLRMDFLDVGDGEAILLRTPSGGRILINGGGSQLRLAEEMGRSLPAFDRQIDWLIVGGVNESQIAALPSAVEYLSPEKIAWAGLPSANYEARQVRAAASELRIPLEFLEGGNRFDLGDGVALEALALTDRGALLLLHWRDFRALLPLGVNSDLLRGTDWGRGIGPIDVLLLAHSGHPDLNPPLWLENLTPGLVLLSVDSANREGYPTPELLETLEPFNLQRTDQNGWIRLITDGQNLWVEAEK